MTAYTVPGPGGASYLLPALPVTAVKTYQAAMPLSTHWRKATCAEIACPHYLNGWRTRVEGLPADLLHAARSSGRRYTEVRLAEGETWLVFEAGQPCFRAAAHRLPNGRPERFFERDGDWRGNPTGRVIEHSPDGWLDSFGEHQERVADAVERG